MDDELDRRDDRELEMIQRQMEQTRASLGDKLGALESQVLDTVQTATEGVATAVEGVKATVDTVSETVQSVTESLNFTKYVEDNPLGAVGCSMGVGFTAGLLFGGSNPPPQPAAAPPPPPVQAAPAPAPVQAAAPCAAPAPADGAGLLHLATTGLAGLAAGALGGVLRGLIVSHLPKDLHGPLSGFVSQITEGLGLGPSPNEDTQAAPASAAETRPDEEGAPHAREAPRRPHNGSRMAAARR